MDELSDFHYFRLIQDFLHHEIGAFAIGLLGRAMSVVGAAAMSVLALWIALRGYRIVTGRSRQPMMGLVTDSLRATLVLGLAGGLAIGGPPSTNAWATTCPM